MQFVQRSGGQLLLLLLSCVGVVISIYLTSVHYQHVPLACPAYGVIDCTRVLSSSYSVIPGTNIPITIPGLAWCLVSAALAWLGWRLYTQAHWLRITQFLCSLMGLVTVFYLLYAEMVFLHTFCIWCTALHFIIIFMFIIAIIRLPRQELEVAGN